MDLSTTLSQDLAALATFLPPVLTAGPAPTGHDELTRAVASLHDAVALSVSSMLGLSITVTAQGQDVTLTSMVAYDPARAAAASLRVPLSVLSVGSTGVVTLHASTPRAFVDLAADLTYELRLVPDPLVARLVLDQHFGSNPVSGITGTRKVSLINMAIGILLDRGHAPEAAEQELRRLTVRSHLQLHEAADEILQDATRPPRT